jgi:hypothetical protein
MWMVFTFVGCGKVDASSTLQEEDTTLQQQQTAPSSTTLVKETLTVAVTTVPEDCKHFCWIMESGADDPIITPVPDINIEKFEALVVFCEKNAYNAIGFNNKAKTRRLPYSASNVSRIRFFEDESEGIALKGAGDFRIWEGNLVLEWYTYSDDYMLVVDVPEDLSQYFIALVDSLELD